MASLKSPTLAIELIRPGDGLGGWRVEGGGWRGGERQVVNSGEQTERTNNGDGPRAAKYAYSKGEA
jgi:hypothetical protein